MADGGAETGAGQTAPLLPGPDKAGAVRAAREGMLASASAGNEC